MKTATCKKCGIREPATHANASYRCAKCEGELVETIRRMTTEGDSTRAIGLRLGISASAVGIRMRTHAIPPALQPETKTVLVNGFGKPPRKLMPSAEALRACSIWSFAVHDRSVFSAPEQVITNDNELFVGS